MEVRHLVRRCSIILALPVLSTFAAWAYNSPPDIEKNQEPILLAGPIGKSSSASARVSLVIPPRPATAPQLKSETADQKQAVKTEQKSTGSKPAN